MSITNKRFRRGVEIGAGDSFSSEFWKRREDFEVVDLYEPNRFLARDLREKAWGVVGVNVQEAAVLDEDKQEKLYCLGYASYLKGAMSPIQLYCSVQLDDVVNDLATVVKVLDVRGIERDGIDVLGLTCNGSELSVLRRMELRPSRIEIKCFTHSNAHKNYCKQIARWMNENGYGATLDRVVSGRVCYHMVFTKE